MNPVACQSGVDLLMDFLDGVLPAEVNAALEAHVAGCERCAAFVASYQATPRSGLLERVGTLAQERPELRVAAE